MKQSLEFLKDRITDKMPLEDMVEIFEDLCSVPIEDEMILFETGTYSAVSNKPLFQLSLVRQAPNEDEEFYQVHLDIFYEASEDNQSSVKRPGTKISRKIFLIILEPQMYLLMLKSKNT